MVSEYYGDQEINEMRYDSYGNIIRKNLCIYTYDPVWKDRLTSYDGKSITYDEQGNPVSYLGHTLTWEKGRQLKSYDSFTYTYNANGIRTSKNINGELHTYDLEGTKILRETWEDANHIVHTIVPHYDNEDKVCGITYNNTTYFFVTNLQGDVIALLDSNGKTVVKYMYDAWGNMFEMYDENDDLIDSDTPHIANINPFRYRGYYYDNETALYYLQSRYYDPNTGRFINSDEMFYILTANRSNALNLYSYCENAPISNIDPIGYFSIPSWTIAVAIDAIIMCIAGWLKATWMSFMAPLKFMGKKAAAKYFAKHIAWRVGGITNSIISAGVKALIWIGKKAFAALFNISAKMAIAAILNEPLRVITAIMSVGGLIAAIWDYFSDRKFNGSIKLW